MKTYIKIFFCGVALSCILEKGFSQPLQRKIEPVFNIGEQLKYRIRYGFIVAAEATLAVKETNAKFEGQPVFHITAQGYTVSPLDVFYKIRDRYDSYIDKSTLLPYFFTEEIAEAGYRRNDKVSFYQKNRKIVSLRGHYEGAEQTFDLASAYYFARSLDLNGLKTGDKIYINYFLNGQVYALEIKYLGKERIKTSSLGYFDCLKFSPSVNAGRVFRKDSKIYLWVTDDENRIPVKAKAEILIGSVVLELTGASGLKVPINIAKAK